MTPETTAHTILAPDLKAALPGEFAGSDLLRDPARFVIELDEAERRELRSILTSLERDGGSLHIENHIHGVMRHVTDRSKRMLSYGDGVVLMRGVPTADVDRDTLAVLFTYLGTALGVPSAQNLDGELVTDIRDVGADATDPEVRLYRTRAEQDFHTDGADVIGLLCLHPAAVGGLSRIVSSVRVYRRIAEERADLASLLFEPWLFHLPGARELGLPGAISRPIATFDGHKLESFFVGWYIRRAEMLGLTPALDCPRRELLALYEKTANDPELYLDMSFRPGDVQWLRNAFVLHKRTAYEDAPSPTPKRHLLRLWLSASYVNDSTPRFTHAESHL